MNIDYQQVGVTFVAVIAALYAKKFLDDYRDKKDE